MPNQDNKIEKQEDVNVNTQDTPKDVESVLPKLTTNSTATEGVQISQQEINELLSMRKELQRERQLKELYDSVGGKDSYDSIAKKVNEIASDEQKNAINDLFKNTETAKQAVLLMKGLADGYKEVPKQEEPSPLPPIGSTTSAGTNIKKDNINSVETSEGDIMEAPHIEMADSITYTNVKDPLVKKALDRIDASVTDFIDKHGHENFDSAELIHEQAVKYLEPVVSQAEQLQNKERAQEALLAYNTILKQYVKAAVANQDPIPARVVKNAKQLVESRNIDNKLSGQGNVDYFADMFTPDESREKTIDDLFKVNKDFVI